MVDYDKIIASFYPKGSDAYNLLYKHSEQVAHLSVALAKRRPKLNVDIDFVFEASMLHDIGIFKTNAPSIYCNGDAPYLQHGLFGKEILSELGLHRHALVCERHIGAGLTACEILEQKLPLPAVDMLPLTIEEKLVCYADNFYSKSKIAKAKPLNVVVESMSKYGNGTLRRLDEMIGLFGSPDDLNM